MQAQSAEAALANGGGAVAGIDGHPIWQRGFFQGLAWDQPLSRDEKRQRMIGLYKNETMKIYEERDMLNERLESIRDAAIFCAEQPLLTPRHD